MENKLGMRRSVSDFDFFIFVLLAWVEIVSSKHRLGHYRGFSAYRINQKRVIAGHRIFEQPPPLKRSSVS